MKKLSCRFGCKLVPLSYLVSHNDTNLIGMIGHQNMPKAILPTNKAFFPIVFKLCCKDKLE